MEYTAFFWIIFLILFLYFYFLILYLSFASGFWAQKRHAFTLIGYSGPGP